MSSERIPDSAGMKTFPHSVKLNILLSLSPLTAWHWGSEVVYGDADLQWPGWITGPHCSASKSIPINSPKSR